MKHAIRYALTGSPVADPRHLRSSARLICIGIASLLLLAAPFGFGAAGDLYVTEIDELVPAYGSVLRISPNGTKEVFAFPVGDPYGIVFDSERQLLVASDPDNTIFRFSPDGVKSTFGSGLAGPIGLAFDQTGNLFSANIRTNSILKFAPNGTRITFASGIGNPLAVATDAGGNVYTGGLLSGTITKISLSGVKSTFATGLNRPYAMVFEPDGNMLVAERTGNLVSRITPGGSRTVYRSGFTSPFGLAFDDAGNLFVSEHDGGRISKVTPEGVQTVFVSGLKSPAFMAFEPAEGAPLNISTRLRVKTEDNVLIGGLIVSGNVPKQVVVRAIGPSLESFGLTDVLQDPVLELHDSTGALIASNDDWRESQESELEATGLAPTNDLESAIVTTLMPGSNTVIVRGKNDTEGVGLVEVYDLTPSPDSRLANISTRGFVDTEDDVMIGGFIVNNNGARILARALGPSLASAGVMNALSDPVLTLFDANGSAIASNDNWQDSQPTAVGATGLAPTDDLESAIATTLANGGYTAIVSGSGGATGVALVEIYAFE